MLLAALFVLAGLYFVDNTPKSCRDLAEAQRRCQFDGCDVRVIERLRRQCEIDREREPPRLGLARAPEPSRRYCRTSLNRSAHQRGSCGAGSCIGSNTAISWNPSAT